MEGRGPARRLMKELPVVDLASVSYRCVGWRRGGCRRGHASTISGPSWGSRADNTGTSQVDITRRSRWAWRLSLEAAACLSRLRCRAVLGQHVRRVGGSRALCRVFSPAAARSIASSVGSGRAFGFAALAVALFASPYSTLAVPGLSTVTAGSIPASLSFSSSDESVLNSTRPSRGGLRPKYLRNLVT